jgi:2-(1,2-epoxy-1,2-dihydrophenyl)acetyl-CoA isomerase
VLDRAVPGLGASLDGGVLHLVLDRPDKRNSLSDSMILGLVAHLESAQQDDDVRAVLLTAAGDHFCGGADVVARNERKGDDAPKPRTGSIQRRLTVQAHRLIPLLLGTQAPVVCAVRGWAAGIGFHLALASDFCVAAETARFWEPFSTRGFTADSGGTWLLPRLVGMARAKELLMLGREVSGTEAAGMGLIHRSVADAEVDDTAAALAARLAAGPTVALGLTKWLLHAGAGLDLERHLQNEAFAMELSSRSPDFREGMAAFVQKRDPDYGGR